MWLNNLGNQRVSLKGEGSWVKGISAYKEGVLQTLLINYDGEGRHSELVPVTFNNLPAKEFVYSRGDFLGGRKSVKVATDSASWRTEELLPANSAALLELRFD